jgi:SAM-dependent methyltransferase
MMSARADLEPQGFREFEHAGWEAIPTQYDDAFSNLTPQAAQPLLDAAAVGPDTHVLDVATGPGYVAAAAAARGARVVAIDFSAAMVECARRHHPDIDVREGDAEALSFNDGTFDAVVMNFGLLHLARPEQALGEARRVLPRGGRCAFTVWAPPEKAVGFGMVLRAVEALGRLDVSLPAGPPFVRFTTSVNATQHGVAEREAPGTQAACPSRRCRFDGDPRRSDGWIGASNIDLHMVNRMGR